MNCNCLETYLEKIQKSLETEGRVVSVKPDFVQTGFRMPDLSVVTYTQVEWEETVTRKNGTQSSKKMKTSVTHSYCPFCGTKIQPAKQKEE